MGITALILGIWNVIVLIIYGWDKLCAKMSKRRVRESTLITTALLLGSVGAMFGMVFFNHKTAKLKFRLTVPFFVLMHVALAYLAILKF